MYIEYELSYGALWNKLYTYKEVDTRVPREMKTAMSGEWNGG
jgi:hypothetical protein